MQKLKFLLACAVVLICGALAAACGKPSEPNEPLGQTEYTVTIIYNDGATPDGEYQVEEGRDFSLPSVNAREGYAFEGWKAGSELYAAGENYTVNGNLTFTAQWAALFAVTFDLAGGTGEFAQADCKAGETVALPSVEPTRADYEFGGWRVVYDDGEGDKIVSVVDGAFVMPAYSVTIAAQWVKLYSVTFDLAGGAGEFAQADCKAGEIVTLPSVEPTRADYEFGGWRVVYDDGEGDQIVSVVDGAFVMPAYPVTVTAEWNAIFYTVTFDLAGGTGSFAQISASAGEIVTLPSAEPTREGYEFDGWEVVYFDEENAPHTLSVAYGRFTMPAYRVTVTAAWNAIVYTVTFEDEQGAHTVRYYAGDRLNEGEGYATPAEKNGVPFGYWQYGAEKVAADAVVSELMEEHDARSLTLFAAYAIVVGKEDFSNGYPAYVPSWTGELRQGQIVTISGRMRSAAQENWQTVFAYLFGGDAPSGLFRFDWWVDDGSEGWNPQNITAQEGWKIALTGEFDWPDPDAGDYSRFRATIANCVFTVQYEWTYEDCILILISAFGLDNSSFQYMLYTLTPAESAFRESVYHIGLNAQEAYAEFDKLTIHTHDYTNGDVCPDDEQINPNHGNAEKGGAPHTYSDHFCTVCGLVDPSHTHEFVGELCTICHAGDAAYLDAFAENVVASYDGYAPAGDWYAHASPSIAVRGEFVVKITYDQTALSAPTTVIECFNGGAQYFDFDPADKNIWGDLAVAQGRETYFTGSAANVVAGRGITVCIYIWRTGDVFFISYEAKNGLGDIVYSCTVKEDWSNSSLDTDQLSVRLTGLCVGATNWKAWVSETAVEDV